MSVLSDVFQRMLVDYLTEASEALKSQGSITPTIESQEVHWCRFFDSGAAKLDPNWTIDLQTYQLFQRMKFLYYNSLFGKFRISNEMYKASLANLLIRIQPVA